MYVYEHIKCFLWVEIKTIKMISDVKKIKIKSNKKHMSKKYKYYYLVVGSFALKGPDTERNNYTYKSSTLGAVWKQ